MTYVNLILFTVSHPKVHEKEKKFDSHEWVCLVDVIKATLVTIPNRMFEIAAIVFGSFFFFVHSPFLLRSDEFLSTNFTYYFAKYFSPYVKIYTPVNLLTLLPHSLDRNTNKPREEEKTTQKIHSKFFPSMLFTSSSFCYFLFGLWIFTNHFIFICTMSVFYRFVHWQWRQIKWDLFNWMPHILNLIWPASRNTLYDNKSISPRYSTIHS